MCIFKKITIPMGKMDEEGRKVERRAAGGGKGNWLSDAICAAE